MRRRRPPDDSQPNLFDPAEQRPDDICRNNHSGEQFSEAANDAAEPIKAIQRGRIVAYLARVGNGTCDEAEKALGISHQAASARFSELKRDGVIVPVFFGDTIVSRPTRHGRQAGVYQIAAREKAEATN